MTLKERFEDIDVTFDDQTSYLKYDEAVSECIKIADYYAVEFAEWLNDWCVKDKDNTSLENIYKHSLFDGYYTIKEMLEIFKKEQKWK